MLFTFPDWDTELFLWLHQNRPEALSFAMIVISSYITWVAVFLFISYLMIKRDKSWGLRATLFSLAGVGVNSLANHILKEIVARPRPTQNEEISHLVDALGYFETNFSFFSAHSSNSFCLAIFTFLYIKNPYIRIGIIIWAILVAYSRVFVGQHYPLDILVGSLFGILTGYLSYRAFSQYKKMSLFKK